MQQHLEDLAKITESIKRKLLPVPQHVEVQNGFLQIKDKVNILGNGDQEALRILKEFLQENYIEITQGDSTAVTIVLAEEGMIDSNLEKLAKQLDVADVTVPESYTLVVQADENKGGIIFIKGKDGAGTFYGVKTLFQLMEKKDNTLLCNRVRIQDEPDMGIRGIVEGFYGEPWSHEDRLDQLKFYGDYKLNTYIYAPKDDPYHREKWREPYPEHEMDRMKDLIETANKNKVDFVFAISPGIDVRFDGEEGEEDFQALLTKSESLYDMGVRSFSILYDDIDNKEGDKQAKLLNRFNEEFIKTKSDVKPLITVPTEYDTHAMGEIGNLNPYTKAFSEHLDKDIIVMWTGEAVVPESLPIENAKFMQEVYGDQIGVWWNYPVTDYLKSKLALGPIVEIDQELKGELDFFLLNPMEHPQLSKISLVTGADMVWNMTDYDADRSWNQAIEQLFNELAPEMKIFANHSSRMTGSWNIGRLDAENVRKIIDKFWLKVSKRKNAEQEMEQLHQEFRNMMNAATTLKEKLPESIIKECSDNLDKLKFLGANGILALDLISAQINKDDDQYNELKAKLEENVPLLERGARVSEKTVLAFIKEALNFNPLPVVSFSASRTLIVPGEKIELYNKSSLTTEEIEWIFEGATVERSSEQKPTVIYENEGVYSVKLIGKNPLGKSEVIEKDFITVTKLVAKGTTNLALGKKATASSFTVPTEKPEFAVDGSTRTKWCADGQGPHTLTVDLGGLHLVSEFIIKHAEEGGEPAGSNTSAYRVLISQDGENFTQLVKVTENENGITKDQVPARKARFVQLIVDQPTQGDDRAARIYEFVVMGLEGDVPLPRK